MAKEPVPSETAVEPAVTVARPAWGWRKYLIAAVLALLGILVLGVAILNSPIGHRYVVQRIASYAPASGLRITIGRIDGSLYGTARLKDVVVSDPQGRFLQVP